MAGSIFLVNVGVNASHMARSPIFCDGTFELLPIPDNLPSTKGLCTKYADIKSFNFPYETLTSFVPKSWLDRPCHYDPEFETFTYGDNCDKVPKAFGLRSVAIGDFIFFLARLEVYENSRFTGVAGFYLIGYLCVQQIYKSLCKKPDQISLGKIKGNAHVQRALYIDNIWNGFWVFQGWWDSRRFKYAVPFTIEFACKVLRQASGDSWVISKSRSDLQIIGSYTRTARCIINTNRKNEYVLSDQWWQMLSDFEQTIHVQECRNA